MSEMSHLKNKHNLRTLHMNNLKPYISKYLNRQHLMKMTKIQLEKLARKEGLELDRREKKESLVEQVLAL